jgi:hypothetical protein
MFETIQNRLMTAFDMARYGAVKEAVKFIFWVIMKVTIG